MISPNHTNEQPDEAIIPDQLKIFRSGVPNFDGVTVVLSEWPGRQLPEGWPLTLTKASRVPRESSWQGNQ